jgi:hypothetical protein
MKTTKLDELFPLTTICDNTNYVHHVGYDSPTSTSHVESMSPTIVNNVGDIHNIEKPRHVRCKPKFLCKTCEGNHLTHLYLAIVEIPEVWFSIRGPSVSEASMVSPHPVSPLIDMKIMPMQSYPNNTPIFEGDAYLDVFSMHPIQSRVEEVVTPVQSLVNPTLLLEGDASFNHVVSIFYTIPSEQERVLLSLSTLPPSPEEVPFDWDGLVGYRMPPTIPFQVTDIIRYIMGMVASASTLSSLTWRDLGFPKIVSSIHKILTFYRIPAQEPWPPP